MRITVLLTALVLAASMATAQTQVAKSTVAGVTNFAKVDTTIACGGAVTKEGVGELKKMGYASIVNLRLASENGADVEGEAAAVKEAGLKYFHLPVDRATPDPAVVDQFLTIIVEPANQPAFIHCGSGNRAAGLWMIKRMVVDGWDGDRASAEATAAGLSSEAFKKFAIDYAAKHKK